MQNVGLCPIAIFSCPLPVFHCPGIKKRTGETVLCVGFIAEELKPQGDRVSCNMPPPWR